MGEVGQVSEVGEVGEFGEVLPESSHQKSLLKVSSLTRYTSVKSILFVS